MPQLPTSTAEEYGAEDEIKQYTQEEDEGSDSSNVDVVNDIKDDLLKEDGRESVKGDEPLFRATSNRYNQKDNQGIFGRAAQAPVIVGPHHNYYEQANGYRSSNSQSQHGSSYQSTTQIRMPMYRGDERYGYEHGAWPSQVPVHGYGVGYGPGGVPKNYNYRYPPHPGVSYYTPGAGYPGMTGRQPKEPKRPHVKKPLNAFMLFMKEQRPKIAAEYTLKESAAINQILGKRWHALDKAEQAKYYELARKERALHMQLYPGWSARDNYAQLGRKKKRPRDKNEEMNPKKCRARYGLDRQEQWCKPCRRKKKCIRFIVGADGETTEVPDKEQAEVHSDSDNENNNTTTTGGSELRTGNINNNNQSTTSSSNDITTTNTSSSLKENAHERVTMANSKENKMLEQQQNTLNNNNNNINILSSSSSSTAHPPSHPSYQLKNNSDSISALYPGVIDHHHNITSSFTSAINSVHFTSSAEHHTIRNETSTIDSSVLKTISASCS